MASYTTNLNLKKPAGSENVAIGDINNNMDTIDTAYGTLNSNLKMNTSRGVAPLITSSTNNSAFTINKGEYFLVVDGTNDGVYKATSQITSNATWSDKSSIVSEKGGLNALDKMISNNLFGSYNSRASAASSIFSSMSNGSIKYGIVGVTGVSNYMFLAFRNDATKGIVIMFNQGNIIRMLYTTDGSSFEEKSLTAT